MTFSKERFYAIAGCLVMLLGCGNEQHKELEQSFDAALEALRVEHQASLADIDQRLSLLENTPQYSFVISDVKNHINEQMFQPLLTTTALLQIKGEGAPASLYVDMVMHVRSEKDNIDITVRQIYPVVDGKSPLEMHQPLPVHGLKLENLNITLKPMNWYQGEAISTDQIEYR